MTARCSSSSYSCQADSDFVVLCDGSESRLESEEDIQEEAFLGGAQESHSAASLRKGANVFHQHKTLSD